MEHKSLYQKISQRKKHKGVLGFENIGPGALGIGLAVVMVAFMALFLARFDASTTDGNATAIIQSGLNGLSEFNNWWSILVLALVFTIVIVIIVAVMSRVGSSTRGGSF